VVERQDGSESFFLFILAALKMTDQVILYRGADLITDDDVILNSLDTASLLVGGLNVRPMLVTKFTTANINAALSNPLTMDASGEFNNMAAAIYKQSATVLEVLQAGQYHFSFVLNVASSPSSVQLQILQGVSVVSTANISPADSGVIMSFPITLAIGDLITFNSVRSGANATAKNSFLTSSSLFITKLN
jgi:hypothetical protein